MPAPGDIDSLFGSLANIVNALLSGGSSTGDLVDVGTTGA
ncbi:hypothetical protein SAMN05444580_108145 [Rhodococcus tukisamuensis]|uniref:Uncharacterized protein n=1 Tax=Rhodococcus tukisamuensis TaxID=168276 RepID=A0A1G6ZAB6_9NOCA|nr:hypothetical protein SAMN05444580_108145 [Rhodococcus tukisamuensis]